jgi:uncharacterized protein YceK
MGIYFLILTERPNMKKLIFLAVALSGCAAVHSGVIPDGKDSYTVIVSQGHSSASAGDLKALAYKEAGAFCKKDHKAIETISEKVVQEGLLSDTAEADLKFRCIEP